ncbi:hypothetical protein ACPOM7_26120 [Peribacillus castrilensis]|nr:MULTISPECIES: hypothetical protein [Bacillaceae]MEA3574196.1 hypothetical protein [Peribacillus frigoritolerans]
MTSKKVRVLVGSPIYQKPHILQKFSAFTQTVGCGGEGTCLFLH